MKWVPSLPTQFIELCIAVKILKGFSFSTRVRHCLMENLSNRFVSRTKSLITFSKNGLRIPEKGVEVQVDGAPVIAHEGKNKTGDRPKPVSRSSNDNPVRIWVDIRISNGLHLSQKNLSYQDPQQCNIFLLQSFAILEINPLLCIRQLKSNRYGRDNCNSR